MKAWRDYLIVQEDEVIEVRCFVLHPIRDLISEDQYRALGYAKLNAQLEEMSK